MVLKTPKIFRGTQINNGSGQVGTYVSLVRHDLDENRKVVEAELERISGQIDPRDQLHLVEGINTRTKENEYLRRFAAQNKIRVINPIVNPFQIEIAEKAQVRELAPLAVLVFDYLGDIPKEQIDRLQDHELEELFKLSLDRVSRTFGISIKKLEKDFSRLSFDNVHSLAEEINLLYQARQSLIKESNAESKVKVARAIDKNPRPYVFAMSGGEHASVFKSGPYSPDRTLKLFNQKQDINPLRKSILAIGNVINQNGINLEAAGFTEDVIVGIAGLWPGMPQSKERKELKQLLEKSSCTIEDFSRLFFDGSLPYFLINLGLASEVMLKIARSIQIGLPESKTLSDSKLMNWAYRDPDALTGTAAISCKGSVREAAINSAKILRILVRNNTDRFLVRTINNQYGEYESPDSLRIVSTLLDAPLIEVRREGADLIYEISKSSLRRYSQSLSILTWNASNKFDDSIRRKVFLAAISADPRNLFLRESDDKPFVIFRGQDGDIERELVKCAQESNPEFRYYGFETLGNYFTMAETGAYPSYKSGASSNFVPIADLPSWEGLLLSGLKDSDEGVVSVALFALGRLLHKKSVSDSQFIPLLFKHADSVNDYVKYNALSCLIAYFDRIAISDPQLKLLAKKNLNNKEENIQSMAACLYGRALSKEQVIDVEAGDIVSAFNIALVGKNKLSGANATYMLSVIANKNMDLISQDRLDELENLCAVNRDPQFLNPAEMKEVDTAHAELVKLAALKDLALLLELGEHPNRDRVEQLIKKKDKYRETVSALWERIDGLCKAVTSLTQRVETLQGANADLTRERDRLKDCVLSLSLELEKYRKRNSHGRIFANSVGRAAVRNLVKQRGVFSGDTVKSIGIDTVWDEGLNMLGNITKLGLGGFFGLG